MPSIPQSEFLSTNNLSQVFNNTTATYKFYWFQSILQMHCEDGADRMNVYDLIIRMIANAWYPIQYFHLSFGSADSLPKIVHEVQWMTTLSMDAERDKIIACLSEKISDSHIRNIVQILTKNVPFRFLRPWIDTSSDLEMIQRSHSLENDCLYSIQKDGNSFYITLNPVWSKYLKDYYGILSDFINWNLTLFLQARNPNIPNIPNKLARPRERASLTRQRHFWNDVIKISENVHCIYTGRLLGTDSNYDIDHFLPWSFLAHDQLWNLIPADSSVNCSKNDRIPDLDTYLTKMAEVHRQAIKTHLAVGKSAKILDDFSALGYTPRDLLALNREDFFAAYQKVFTPLSQIARNMGYEIWKG